MNPVPETEEWRYDAACIGHPPELFIDPTTPTAIAQAKHICGDCHVANECRTAALTENVQVGIRGGLTIEERQGPHPECGTPEGYNTHKRRRERKCPACIAAHQAAALASGLRKQEQVA